MVTAKFSEVIQTSVAFRSVRVLVDLLLFFSALLCVYSTICTIIPSCPESIHQLIYQMRQAFK